MRERHPRVCVRATAAAACSWPRERSVLLQRLLVGIDLSRPGALHAACQRCSCWLLAVPTPLLQLVLLLVCAELWLGWADGGDTATLLCWAIEHTGTAGAESSCPLHCAHLLSPWTQQAHNNRDRSAQHYQAKHEGM